MGKRRCKLPSPATAIALVALFVALGGTGYAVVATTGIPDRAGVFHGCVDKRTGVLRVVSGAGACHRAHGKGRRRSAGEFAVSWSQKGPAGLPGRNGTNGQNGTNGSNGSNGTNGSAVAYAAVDASGNVDPSASKGITQADTSHTAPGIYCFRSVGFTPHAVNVSPWNPGGNVGDPSVNRPVTHTTWLIECGSLPYDPNNAFIVIVRDTTPSQQNSGFFLTIN
jgi:hypothetical protein